MISYERDPKTGKTYATFGPGESPYEKTVEGLNQAVMIPGLGLAGLAAKGIGVMPGIGQRKFKPEAYRTAVKEHRETLKALGFSPKEIQKSHMDILKGNKSFKERALGWIPGVGKKLKYTSSEQLGKMKMMRTPQRAVAKTVQEAVEAGTAAKKMGLGKGIENIERFAANPKYNKFLVKPMRNIGVAGMVLPFAAPYIGMDKDKAEALSAGIMGGWALSEMPKAIVESAASSKALKAAFHSAGGGMKGIKATLPHLRGAVSAPFWGLWALGSGYMAAKKLLAKPKKVEVKDNLDIRKGYIK